MEFLREGGKVISSYKLNCVQIYGGQPNEKKTKPHRLKGMKGTEKVL